MGEKIDDFVGVVEGLIRWKSAVRYSYPRSRLSLLLIVINFDDSSGNGTHWVCVKKVENILFYFDSFGVLPLPEIKRNDKEVIYNCYRIQDFDSELCGYFCIDFLNSVSDFHSYIDWLLNYKPNDFKKNNEIVLNRLNLE